MEQLYRTLLERIGEDPTREGLLRTPERAAKTMQFLTQGYTQSIDEICSGALFASDSEEMILVKDIELYSLCEHHLLPFIGKAHIGYVPRKHIIGVSKVARIVDIYARRLQVQERLTTQVAGTLMERLGCLGVGVVIEAQHLCMMMRGAQKQNSVLKTSCLLGTFQTDAATREQFLTLIR